jgi:hypothetical protein
MGVYERGDVWWYSFNFAGKHDQIVRAESRHSDEIRPFQAILLT